VLLAEVTVELAGEEWLPPSSIRGRGEYFALPILLLALIIEEISGGAVNGVWKKWSRIVALCCAINRFCSSSPMRPSGTYGRGVLDPNNGVELFGCLLFD